MNGNEQNYTVKELLTLFVIPRLEKIEGSMATKADAEDITALDTRVRVLEQSMLTPSGVAELIRKALEDQSARGWTTRERAIGVVLFVVTVSSFALNVFAFAGR